MVSSLTSGMWLKCDAPVVDSSKWPSRVTIPSISLVCIAWSVKWKTAAEADRPWLMAPSPLLSRSSVPSAPVGFCPRPGCPERSNGPCPAHQRENRKSTDERRGSFRERYGSTSAWDRLSASFRAEFPFCGMRADGLHHAEHSRCVQRGHMTKLAEQADHIVPISHGGALLDRANLQSLCKSCNAAKGDGS